MEGIVIELNGTKVSSSNINYPYRAIFETLLNYGEDAKKSVLQSQLFYKDDSSQMDTTSIGPTANSGFKARNEISKGGAKFEMYGKLHADILFQDRYMLNNVAIKIKLTGNSPAFSLIGKVADCADASIKIHNIALYVRRVTVAPDVIEGHIAAFRSGFNAIYPIKRVETVHHLLSRGITSEVIQNLKYGALPNRIVIGLVENDVLNGVINKNPFHFKHHNLKEIVLTHNGIVVPYKGIKFDFEKGEYIRGFHSLFSGIDKPIFTTGNNIERLDWCNGYTLFAFDLTPDLCSGDYTNLIKQGNLRLEVSFSTGLTSPVSVIAYLEFDDKIEITEERRVLYEVN